jgi:hypothetical protein
MASEGEKNNPKVCPTYDRFGSIASVPPCPTEVRFTLDSDRIADIPGRQLRANSRHCGAFTGSDEPYPVLLFTLFRVSSANSLNL